MTWCRLVQLAVVVTVMTMAGGQIPVPPRRAGFVYRCGQDNAPIQFDLYIDLTCSDSMAAFPTVGKVADYYGPDTLRLTTFLFALPYHRNAYAASKGAHAVDIVTRGNLTYTWFATIFNNLASLTDSATRNFTDIDVLDRLVNLASAIGVPEGQFQQQIVSSQVASLARNGWKYACTRSVAATPSFFINGVEVREAQSTWTEQQWHQLIDSLLTDSAYQIYSGDCEGAVCPSAPRCEPYRTEGLSGAHTVRASVITRVICFVFVAHIITILS